MTTTREAALEAALRELRGNIGCAALVKNPAGIRIRAQADAALSTPATEPQGYAAGLEAAMSAIKKVPCDFRQSAYALAVDAVAVLIQAAHPAPQPAAPDAKTAAAIRMVIGTKTELRIAYTNWRGETADRTIVPFGLRFDVTQWHPEEQWLVSAWDVEKKAVRDFALKDMVFKPAADARGVVVKPLVWVAGLAEEGPCWRAENPAQPGQRYVAFTPADKEEWDAKHTAAILSTIIGAATPAQSDKIAEAARELELANDALCGARPQKVYDEMIAAGMADYMTRLDDARREVRDVLRALVGKGE